MALKSTKRRDTENPNTPLVLFLVFFVLLSIGLGLWGYFGYAGRAELRTKTEGAQKGEQAAKLGEEYHRLIELDTRLALGNQLDPDDLNFWKDKFADLTSDTSRFRNEKTFASVKKMIEENQTELGFDKANSKYLSTFRDRTAKLAAELKKSQAELSDAQTRANEADKKIRETLKREKAFWDKMMAKVTKDNEEALAKAQEKTQEIETAVNRYKELQRELEDINGKHQKKIQEFTAQINDLNVKLQKAKELAGNAGLIRATSTEPHALLLDISRGKSLWEQPLGKIVRVDFESKQVVINMGSASGIRPETTFMVFAASPKGQGEGLLKGTIEVVRVINGNTSVARITSLFDASGAEIPLNDIVRGRLQREADNPLKEGDVIYNLIFQTHVAIAGVVNWTGADSDNPSEQMQNLREFMRVLERQGVVVDGYLDLVDFKFKGNITSATRFLIRGDDLHVSKTSPEFAKRATQMNQAIQEVRKDAVERGAFIISSSNLAHVIGWRRPRSASNLEVSGFRPGVPGAGIER
jgi:hypothetical protein